MRRLLNAMVLALATGTMGVLSPVASAAPQARLAATPGTPGEFGVRLVDVPVSQAGNPRGYRYIIDCLPAGTVIHRRILIINAEPRAARFSVYPDAAHIAGGLFAGDAGATRSELTTWISMQHQAVTLAPGASALDMVTVRVPRGATRGEHYGVIWVQQAARPGLTGFGLTEVSRVGVRVYLTVGRGGTPPPSFDIDSITGRRPPGGQPVITAHVTNTGGRAIDLTGSARLTSGPGETSSGPFPARQMVTLAPGQSWNVAFALPRSLPSGSWRVTVTLASGLTTATGTATVQVAPAVSAPAGQPPMPRVWLAPGILALVLVLALGRYRGRIMHQAKQALLGSPGWSWRRLPSRQLQPGGPAEGPPHLAGQGHWDQPGAQRAAGDRGPAR